MDTPEQLLELAESVLKSAQHAGADEVSVAVSRGSQVSIERRGGKVEQATESTTRGLVLSVLSDDRFSSNSTSDLRPGALKAFIERSVASTRYLEPDPARRQPDAALCGRGVDEATLDQDDPAWAERTADDRAEQAEAIERLLLALPRTDRISCSSYVSDGRAESVQVLSNGFRGIEAGAWFAAGGDMTLEEGDRRPESGAWYAARHLGDLPSVEAIAAEIEARVTERLGSKAAPSGTYPMVLANRSAGRILGVLGGPMGGGSLHEHRSCLEGKLGERIGSDLFTLIDDPTIPRGLGSRPWDGDALRSKPRTLVENGVLKQYNIGVYYGRKLGMEPTSGGRSNWVIPPGQVPLQELLKGLPKAILVTGFLGGNSNGSTGDFSFGIRGTMLEHGEPAGSLSEMNVTGNVTDIFQRLVAVGDDPWTWSSVRSPTLIFDDVQFSGT
jgi:PmbA protein